MNDRYDRVREGREFRREVARTIGLGFAVPKVGGKSESDVYRASEPLMPDLTPA